MAWSRGQKNLTAIHVYATTSLKGQLGSGGRDGYGEDVANTHVKYFSCDCGHHGHTRCLLSNTCIEITCVTFQFYFENKREAVFICRDSGSVGIVWVIC